ncbi:hypothetical protein [Halalkalibacter urbisdiaboli]|uniref:hypothetical protein n=1 Tax=Halalkalibacter urbisdiaboli TaxID=1960589 RepID=UPI001054E004|nr:hypothetical protein [Halalkalibacter urbisdiaboli]
MNFTIDLLPKVERVKKTKVPVIPVVGFFVTIAATIVLIYSYIEMTKSVEALEASIATQTSARDHLQQQFQQQMTGVTEYNFVTKYQMLEKALNTTYEETIILKNRFYDLLPEEAVIENFSIDNAGDLTMIVTFQSKGQAAIYLHSLLQADFVEAAEVQTIDTSQEEELFYTSLYQLKLKTIAGEGQ